MTYQIKLTQMALTFARSKSSVETVEAKCRVEISELGTEDPLDIFFHCFKDEGVDYVATPKDGFMHIDTCSYLEMEMPETEVPFLKGKKFLYPVPDSDDR